MQSDSETGQSLSASASAKRSTGRRAQIQAEIDNVARRSGQRNLSLPQHYKVDAGLKHSDPRTSDPDPSAFRLAGSNYAISGDGSGTIEVDIPDKSIFHFVNPSPANRPKNVILRDFENVKQPYSRYDQRSGLTDDYFAVRFEATETCRAENLHFDSPELALTFQYAQTVLYAKANQFNAGAAVNVAANTITVNAHDIATGDKVQVRKNGAASAPQGIVIGQSYYGIRIDSNRIKLATSRANARSGKAIDLKSSGSGQLVVSSFRRGSFRNRSANCTGQNVRYMFLQLFGEQGGVHSGHRASGLAASGKGRAPGHGVRFAGYPFAPCEGNFVSGHMFTRFANGFSLQQFSRSNQGSVTAVDCQNGISVARTTDGTLTMGDYTAAEATPQGNVMILVARDCDFGIYDDGGSHNSYDVNIFGAKQKGIYLSDGGGVEGLATGNKYVGNVRTTGKRAVEIKGPNTTVDLDISGGGISVTDYGLLCTANGLRGSIKVQNCTEGLRISGNNARLTVRVTNTRTALVINGDGCIVDCDIDGDVIIGGNNNKLTGTVRGTITLGGSPKNNDLSNVRYRG